MHWSDMPEREERYLHPLPKEGVVAMSYEYVKSVRKRLEERIVYVMGEKCCICNYDKTLLALELHHIDKKEKEFTVSVNANKNWATVRKEIEKCTLVCSNCHREIEAEITPCPPSSFNEERALEIDLLIENIKTKMLNYMS